MDIREIFAKNVRRFRKQASLTQEQLAERSGFHRTYIGGIEQPGRNVSLKVLESLATIFEVEPSKMLEPMDDEDDGPTDAVGMPGRTIVDSTEEDFDYALCKWEDGEVVVKPIEVNDEDLSMRILCELARQGSTDLATDYDQVVELVDKFMSERAGRERRHDRP